MTEPLRAAAERLARRTSRRGLFGRGADVLFGTLAGVAAGAYMDRRLARATDRATHCIFPGPACECDKCRSNGVCAKPCVIWTEIYASGCWTTSAAGKPEITCCDCDCQGINDINTCGCGSDYHNDPAFCPEKAA